MEIRSMNLLENKVNVSAVSEELKQYDLLKLSQGFRVNIMGNLMMISRKLITFGLMKWIRKCSPLSILCKTICKKMKRSCQEDLKLNQKTKSSSSSSSSKSKKSGKSFTEKVIHEK